MEIGHDPGWTGVGRRRGAEWSHGPAKVSQDAFIPGSPQVIDGIDEVDSGLPGTAVGHTARRSPAHRGQQPIRLVAAAGQVAEQFAEAIRGHTAQPEQAEQVAARPGGINGRPIDRSQQVGQRHQVHQRIQRGVFAVWRMVQTNRFAQRRRQVPLLQQLLPHLRMVEPQQLAFGALRILGIRGPQCCHFFP